MKKVVLFHRNFHQFTGGQLKVWHYFNHVDASSGHEARIAFSSDSSWDSSNPWVGLRDRVVDWNPASADILFLAGNDWRALPAEERPDFTKPIINLIQHQRHADEGSELRKFLGHRACRICVSDQVAAAINATGEVNGPVFVIPNGIDVPPASQTSWETRTIDLLICGLKAPELAKEVQIKLRDLKITAECLTEWLPRSDYLARLNQAKVALCLPRPLEGFYLPPLEAMACGTVVVCPDCVGNRGFCEDEVNCFRPNYDLGDIVKATRAALAQSTYQRESMLKQATTTLKRHSLENERSEFLRILNQLDRLWTG